jgi:hypothetical protein
VSKEGVTICNTKEEYKKEIAHLFTQFVDKERVTVYQDRVVAYSTVLVKYLEGIFKQRLGQKKSDTITSPNIITKASKEVLTAFLASAYKGDGHVGTTKIEYATKSKHLAEGMTYMLTLLGIKYNYWERKDGCHLLTITGKKEMNLFRNQVMKENRKTSVRKEYNAQYNLPPVSPLLRRLKEELRLHYDKEIPDGSFEQVISGRRKIGLLRLQRLMRIYHKHATADVRRGAAFRTLELLAKGSLAWTTVKRKKRAQPQVMYDLETEHGAFIGGNIPLLLHNSKWVGESEKAVRKIFEKARQTAPTIIFFDEVDAIAPRRGASDGSDSHVTERVVNQLLTEMDGLQDLNDVVIVAATNRPDIIDTALLRPGRFDRIVFVPVPDKKTRKQIFQIHTKGMALDKDIDLDDLTEKTEGYVGADIESVCREAAILALRKDMKAKTVKMEFFKEALEKVHPSTTKEIEEAYRELEEHFRSAQGARFKEEKPSYYG